MDDPFRVAFLVVCGQLRTSLEVVLITTCMVVN